MHELAHIPPPHHRIKGLTGTDRTPTHPQPHDPPLPSSKTTHNSIEQNMSTFLANNNTRDDQTLNNFSRLFRHPRSRWLTIYEEQSSDVLLTQVPIGRRLTGREIIFRLCALRSSHPFISYTQQPDCLNVPALFVHSVHTPVLQKEL